MLMRYLDLNNERGSTTGVNRNSEIREQDSVSPLGDIYIWHYNQSGS